MENYLSRHNSSWKPKYAKTNTSFNAVMAGWRKEYANANKAKNAVRKARILENFGKNYKNWVQSAHNAHVAMRKRENAFRQAVRRAAPGNKARVANSFGNVPTHYNLPAASQTRLTAYRKNTFVNKNAIRRKRNNIMSRKANLEAKRNALERQISNLMNNYRNLHQAHNWLYNN